MDELAKVRLSFINSNVNTVTYIKKVIVMDLQNETEMTGLSKITKKVASHMVW